MPMPLSRDPQRREVFSIRIDYWNLENILSSKISRERSAEKNPQSRDRECIEKQKGTEAVKK
jgi:hypothetical protein